MIAAMIILIAMCGTLLLLMLFLRIRDAGKELRLDQHRSKEMGFADLLVYAAMVEDGVIVGKNGALMAAWVFCGDDTASSTDTERERVSFRINQALSIERGTHAFDHQAHQVLACYVVRIECWIELGSRQLYLRECLDGERERSR